MALTGASENAVNRRIYILDKAGIIKIHKISHLSRRIEICGKDIMTAPTRPSKRIVVERAPKEGTTVRPCLRCQRDFNSEGVHNRVCVTCKSTQEWISDSGMTGSTPARPVAAKRGAG